MRSPFLEKNLHEMHFLQNPLNTKPFFEEQPARKALSLKKNLHEKPFFGEKPARKKHFLEYYLHEKPFFKEHLQGKHVFNRSTCMMSRFTWHGKPFFGAWGCIQIQILQKAARKNAASNHPPKLEDTFEIYTTYNAADISKNEPSNHLTKLENEVKGIPADIPQTCTPSNRPLKAWRGIQHLSMAPDIS